MGELAELGLRVRSEEPEAAAKSLDKLSDSASKAEKATDGLSASQDRAKSATAQMNAEIDRAVRNTEQMARASGQAVSASRNAANAMSAEALAAKRLADTMEQVRAGQLRAVPGVNGTTNYVPVLKSQAEAATVAAAAVSKLDNAIVAQGQSAAGAANDNRRVADATDGAARSAMGLAGAAATAVANVVGFSIAGVAVDVLTAAFEANRISTENAARSTENYTSVMLLAEDAVNGVATATYRLADARKEAARQAISNAIAENNAEIKRLENPDWKTRLGRFVMGQFGEASAATDDLRAENLRSRNASLLSEQIAVTMSDAPGAVNPMDAAARLRGTWEDIGNNMSRADIELRKYHADLEAIRKVDPKSRLLPSDAEQRATEAAIRERYKERGRRPRQAPRDMTDERSGQVASAIAQAEADLLRAQLALTRDVGARSTIEKAILDQTLAEKSAQIDRQVAAIVDDKGLSAGKKKELTHQLELVRGMGERVTGLQKQLIDQQTADALAQQVLKKQQAGYDIALDSLRLAGELATTAGERRDIELRILDLADQRQAAELQAIIALNSTTEVERQIAQARLDALRATRGTRETIINNRAQGPIERWVNDNTDPKKIAEQNATYAAQTFDQLAGSLASAATSADDLDEAVKNFISQTARELLEMNLRRGAAALAKRVGIGVAEKATDQAAQQAAAVAAGQAMATAITTAGATTGTTLSTSITTSGTASATSIGTAITSAGAAAATAMGTAILTAGQQAAAAIAAASAAASVPTGGGGAPGAATGGLIKGAGTGTSDSILARVQGGGFLRVSNGEFIVNAEATRQNLALLTALNDNADIPGLASGGPVAPPMVSSGSRGSGGNIHVHNYGPPIEVERRRTANGDMHMDIRPLIREGAKHGVREAMADGTASRAKRLERGPTMRA